MRREMHLGLAGVLLLAFGLEPVLASPPTGGPASRLSAAAGGTLDSDIGEAGTLTHAIDYASITLVAGRSVEYRRRVAREMRQASLTASGQSRPTSMR
jgi:hypothetical protein